MSLPTTLTFAAGDLEYIPELNTLLAAINELYTIAVTLQNLVATSTSTNTIAGSGSVTFTLAESSRNFGIGMVLTFASSASPTNYMTGRVTAYSGTTLTATMTASSGSGSFSAWSITLASGTVPATSLSPGGATALQVLQVNAAGTGIQGASISLTDVFSPFLMPSMGQI